MSEKKVWIKADIGYIWGNIVATLIYALPAAILVALGAFVIGQRLPEALNPTARADGHQLILATAVGISVTVVFLGSLFIVYQFRILLRTFYMTVSRRDALYKLHDEWNNACTKAHSEGRPLPRRPY